jgi:hypothetical protein
VSGAVVREFVSEIWEESGLLGWRQRDRPEFWPLEGAATAHDVLEHFADEDGSPEAELRALGAILWTRGVGGWFAASGGVHPEAGWHVAGDVEDVIRRAESGFRAPPSTRPLRDADAEAQVELACSHALRGLLEASEGDLAAWSRVAVEAARGWLRVGFRRAIRRYRDAAGLEAEEVANLYRELRRIASEALREAGGIGEGCVLRVSVSVRDRRIRASLRVGDGPDGEVASW